MFTERLTPPSEARLSVYSDRPYETDGPCRYRPRSVLATALPLAAADCVGLTLSLFATLSLLEVLLSAETSLIWLIAPLWPLTLVGHLALGLYPGVGVGPFQEFRAIQTSSALAHLGLAAMLLAGGSVALVVVPLMLNLCIACLVLPMMRAASRLVLSKQTWWLHPVLVIGGSRHGIRVFESLKTHATLGLRPIGIVDDFECLDPSLESRSYLGPLSQVPALAARYRLRFAVLATPDHSQSSLQNVLAECTRSIPNLLCLPDPSYPGHPSIRPWNVGEANNFAVMRTPSWQCSAKRVIDICLSALLLPFLLVLMAIIALLIKLTSRGPAIYAHKRIGKDGCHFLAFKFRTMVRDSREALERHLTENPEDQSEWSENQKLKNDPRVTRLGRVLRSTSLDELPQIFNVLRGEMSLVGPRPIYDPAEVRKYGDLFAVYCEVAPGITGLWQISGRNNTTYEERVAHDAHYVRNWSLWFDFYILYRTIRVVLTGDGAY